MNVSVLLIFVNPDAAAELGGWGCQILHAKEIFGVGPNLCYLKPCPVGDLCELLDGILVRGLRPDRLAGAEFEGLPPTLTF